MTNEQVERLLEVLSDIASKIDIILTISTPAVSEEDRASLERARYDADVKMAQALSLDADLRIVETTNKIGNKE